MFFFIILVRFAILILRTPPSALAGFFLELLPPSWLLLLLRYCPPWPSRVHCYHQDHLVHLWPFIWGIPFHYAPGPCPWGGCPPGPAYYCHLWRAAVGFRCLNGWLLICCFLRQRTECIATNQADWLKNLSLLLITTTWCFFLTTIIFSLFILSFSFSFLFF